MIGEVCPPVSSQEYKDLVAKVGEYAAIRSWTKNLRKSEWGDSDDALQEVLNKMDPKLFTVAEKHRIIDEYDRRLVAPTEDNPSYRMVTPEGEVILSEDGELTRVSSILDKYSATKFRHVTGLPIFKETGTKFHDIIHDVGDKLNAESINKKLEEYGIPKQFYPDVQGFLNGLISTGGGTLLFEKKIYSESAKVAGQVDLIHLKGDGTIDVYDFKTVYKTPLKKQKEGENPWNPVGYDNGYKANRYTAQLEAYGRILEEMLGQPVSNYKIVPILVELDAADNVVHYEFFKDNGKIKTDDVMKDYHFARSSKIIMDEVFNYKDVPGSSGLKLNTIDDSSAFVNRLTGKFVNYQYSAMENAQETLEKANKFNGGRSYWNGISNVPFKIGATQDEKLNQIIQHFDSILASDRAYSQGIQDFIETNDSKFLDAFGVQAKGLKTIFGQYAGRKDLKVMDLQTIQGFEDKKGWIAIKDDENYDLYYITGDNLNSVVRTPKAQTGLFSEWFPRVGQHASYLHTSLKNTYGDAKAFEAVLVAMKMKESFPEATFGNIQLYSMYDRGSVYNNGKSVALNEILPTVNILWNDNTTKSLMPKNMESIFTKSESFNPEIYQQDYIKLYANLTQQGIVEENGDVLRGINSYIKSAENKKQLSDILADKIIERVELGEDVESNLETTVLAKMYFQINKIHQNATGITWWKNNFSAAQNHSDPLLQQIYSKKNQAVGKIQQTFWYDYKQKFEKLYESLVKDAGGLVNAPRDFTRGDTSRYWEPLMEKKKVSVVNPDDSVSEKEIFTFNLKAENSPDFQQLTPVQQDAIRGLNSMMEKMNINGWEKGFLPIIRGDFYNQIYNARKEKGIEGYKRAVDSVLTDVMDVFLPSADSKNKELSNVFLSQAGQSKRNKLIGITPDNMLNNVDYSTLSTNVEVMMDAFMIQGLKYEAFRDLAAIIKGASAINAWSKTNLLNSSLGTTNQHLKDTFTVTIQNKDVDSDKPISRVMRSVNKTISLFALGLKPATGLVNYFGIEFGMLSQAVANTVSKTGGYGIGDSAKAHAIAWGALGKKAVNGDDYEKISQLMTKFRLHNQDLGSFMNGYHRVSDKSVFRSKIAFGLMNATDWMARSTMMISQMIHDGTWDAYSMEKDAEGNKKLVYNQSKDKRWSKLDPKQAAAMKQSIVEQQNEDGVNDTQELNDAYDSRYTTRMKAQANEIAGAMNREDRNNAHFTWWGRMFTFFKSWLPVKIDKYINTPMSSDIMGNMTFETDANGDVKAIWKGEQMEGILYTMVYTLGNIDKLIKGKLPMSSYQKNNLYKATGDVIMVALITALAKGILDDEDDNELDEYMSKVLLNATADLTAVFELMTLDEFYYTPANLTFIKKRINNVYNIAGGIADPDSSVLEQIGKQVPGQFEEWDILLTGQGNE